MVQRENVTKHHVMRSIAGAVALAAVLGGGPSLAQDKRDTLRVGLNAGSPFLGNPFQTRGAQPLYFMASLYESVTIVGPDGSIQPMLAESWQVVDPLTWRYKLRTGSEFTNGKPNNAANLVKNINFLLSETGRSLQVARLLLDIESARDIGNNTVEIKTKAPLPRLPTYFSEVFVVEADAWNERGVQEYSRLPVSSGPWRAVTWTTDGFLGTAFEKAMRPAKIKNLSIVGMPEAVTRTQTLISDQLDLVTNMPPDDIARFQSAGHAAEVTPAPVTVSAAIYEQKPGFNPFKDRRVRLAANMALDRDNITKGLMKGLATPAHQAATPMTRGYNADIKPYPYDPEGAKRLLAEAGYPNGFDTALQFNAGGHPYASDIFTLLGDSLTKVGIRTKVVPIVLSELTNLLRKVGGRDFEGHLFGYSAFVDPDLDGARPFENHSCIYSPPWSCLPNVEALRVRAGAEFDLAKRTQLLKELIRVAHDEAAMINIFHDVDVFGVNKRIGGFTNWNRRIILENFTIKG